MARWTKAASGGAAGTIAALLVGGAVYFSWARGEALRDAVKRGDSSRVADLLNNGADPNTDICTEYRPPDWPGWISAWFSPPKTCSATEPLLVFASGNPLSSRTVSALVHGGAKPNRSGSNRITALHAAVRQNDGATVDLLLRAGANPNASSFSGSALWDAVLQENIPIAQRLLLHGADPNGRDYNGNLPTIIAVEKDNLPLLRVLTQHGAKLNLEGNYHDTPLQRAAGMNALVCLTFLLDSGGDPNQKNAKGGTALMEAAALGQIDAVRLLLARGATPNAQNPAGKTALNLWSDPIAKGIKSRFYFKNTERELVKPRPEIPHRWVNGQER